MKVIPTVGIVVLQDDNVLLVRHEKGADHLRGVYGIPGGRIEPGETEVQAAKRELEEETGLVAAEEDFIKLSFETPFIALPRSDGTTKHFSWKVYLCKKYSGQIRATNETTPEWAAIHDLDKYENMLPNTKKVAEEGIILRNQ